MKNRIYNLIVLDESGSMSRATSSTISGCNETINVCKSSDTDTIENFISIYAFQSGAKTPSRYIVKNVPASACEHITNKEYSPWGGTPLYDAIGSTISDLLATIKAHEGAIGSVTIITDGEENSSEHYTRAKVVTLIDRVKEMGWHVSFIGANIDAATVGASMHIEATMQFTNDAKGTSDMWASEKKARMCYNAAVADIDECTSPTERVKRLKKASHNYFSKK